MNRLTILFFALALVACEEGERNDSTSTTKPEPKTCEEPPPTSTEPSDILEEIEEIEEIGDDDEPVKEEPPTEETVVGPEGLVQHWLKKDPISETTCLYVKVKHQNQKGDVLVLRHAHAKDPAGETVPKFASRVNALVAINGSPNYAKAPSGKLQADGLQIVDGQFLYDVRTSERYTLAIKANNTISAFHSGRPVSDLQDAGAINALTGFVPLLRSSAMVKSSIMECSGTAGRNKQPRQAIAQYENLDLLILSCGGRDKEKDGKSWGPGVTARDVAHLLLFEGVKFGFLLDDGGSVMTVVDGQRLTPQFDDAGDRKRPNFLWIEAP